ncbi:MAG: hypothetical protein IJ504_01275 [Bacteroidales bacterium]|nr:hypothetical protein [Bacteroidales bacterium]
MRRTYIIMCALSALVLASCTKDLPQDVSVSGREVVIAVDECSLDMSVTSKATAVTSVPSSLYIAVTSGSSNTQTSQMASVSKSVSGGKISTGLFQTTTPTPYNYYVSNVGMTFNAAGCTVAATNATDVIVGLTTASTSTAPSVTMNHVFARIGTFSCSSSNSYTLSNLTYKIQSKTGGGTAGTYNLYTGAWSGLTALGSTTMVQDMYLVPGTYTVTVSGTKSYGDYSASFSASADVTLVAGKINNISASYGASGAQEIVISTTLNAWGTNTITPTIS